MAPLPVLFLGHGNPMNALERNVWTEAWTNLGRSIGKPRAILIVSAHWYVPRLAVTSMEMPRTIHDFGGFPRALYDVQYPAPGDPDLARDVQDRLRPRNVELDEGRGLDHGTWAVLCHVVPRADVPVVQLSIDRREPPSFHYELGRWLSPLRDEGVLILGSGNLVHNLHAYDWGREGVEPYDWAVRFERRARELMVAADHEPLIAWESLGRDASLSIPTPDHYLPLLFVLGARREREGVRFPCEGIDGGSVSMLSVCVG